MHTAKVFCFSFSLAALALTLGAAEVWTKDSKDWTDADVQRILTGSPWAQKAAASVQSERRDDGNFPSDPNGAGGGYPGGSQGGAGGGMGMPGSGGGMGRSGGGMGIPGAGGGVGYPGGGGGRGRRNGGDNSSTRNRMEVVIRWDSAAPVKQALAKSNAALSDTEGKGEKSYIISVAGLHMPGNNDPEHMRNVLIASTQLLVKGKDAIDPEDLKMQSENDGTATAQFFFPRSHPLDLDDKEVTFITQTGTLKLEHKFKLKEMVYNGKLSL